MINEDVIEFPETPITDKTFEDQGWLKVEEIEEDENEEGETYVYWYYMLPLPKDNPDEDCPALISNCNDEHQQLNLPKGHYFVEMENMNGLGFCQSEEQIEILYRALTGKELYEE